MGNRVVTVPLIEVRVSVGVLDCVCPPRLGEVRQGLLRPVEFAEQNHANAHGLNVSNGLPKCLVSSESGVGVVMRCVAVLSTHVEPGDLNRRDTEFGGFARVIHELVEWNLNAILRRIHLQLEPRHWFFHPGGWLRRSEVLRTPLTVKVRSAMPVARVALDSNGGKRSRGVRSNEGDVHSRELNPNIDTGELLIPRDSALQ